MLESLFCSPVSPTYLIVSPNVPAFIYYSHFVALVTSILIIFYVLKFGTDKLVSRVLSFTFLSFASWVVLALIFWASNRGDIIMFVWSITLLVEPLVYIGALYLVYLLSTKKDLPFKYKIVLSILYLPLIILVPTKYSLPGFDLSTCYSIEGPIALYYTYIVEFIVTIALIGFTLHKIYTSTGMARKEIASFSIGIILFLFAFAWGNIIGSFTENWQLGQYGLFGMPIFVGFLAYSIVKFKTFNIKLIGTQALVVALWILIVSILFIDTIENVRIVIAVTAILLLILGINLIRSVKREIEQRQKIEELAGSLRSVNRILSHDVKNVLGKNKDLFLESMHGDFCTLSEGGKNMYELAYTDTTKLLKSIMTILQSGQAITLSKAKFDVREALNETLKTVSSDADKKGLKLELQVKEGNYEITGDKNLLTVQVFENLLENAIHYTPKGSVFVHLEPTKNGVLLTIKDTGIGITEEDKKKLFTEGGHGKDSLKVNVHSTGYGLYIAKKIVDAHGGHISAESEGPGKGSTFSVELPA